MYADSPTAGAVPVSGLDVGDGFRVDASADGVLYVDQQEIGTRGLAVVPSGFPKLRVKFREELRVDPDGAALGQRVASAPSVAAIRASALRRARARRSGGTAASSVTNPARTAASRSSGDSTSSSAAV